MSPPVQKIGSTFGMTESSPIFSDRKSRNIMPNTNKSAYPKLAA